MALREIALRRSAVLVNRIAEEERNILEIPDIIPDKYIPACISALPSSAKVIRTAARLSYAFHAQFTALYVETPSMQEAGREDETNLKKPSGTGKGAGSKNRNGVW